MSNEAINLFNAFNATVEEQGLQGEYSLKPVFRKKRQSKAERAVQEFIERNLREMEQEYELAAEQANVEFLKVCRRRGYEMAMSLSIAQMTQGNKETASANPHIVAAFKDFLMADGDDEVRTEVFTCEATEAFEADEEGNTSMDEEYLHMLDELPKSPTFFRSARAEKAGRNVASGERAKFARDIKDSVLRKQRAKTQSRVTVTSNAAKKYREALELNLYRAMRGSLAYFCNRKYLRLNAKLQEQKARELYNERQLIEHLKEQERMRTEIPKLSPSPKKAEPKKYKAPKTGPMEYNNGIPYPRIRSFDEFQQQRRSSMFGNLFI